jgi:hypothetical protein
MPNNKATLWTGRVLSTLFVLFWIMDLTMKLMDLEIVRTTGAQLGLPAGQSQLLGVLELVFDKEQADHGILLGHRGALLIVQWVARGFVKISEVRE